MQSVHVTIKVVSSNPVHGVKKTTYTVANSICRQDKFVDPDHNCLRDLRGSWSYGSRIYNFLFNQ